mmetsp:Transcript_29069/g.61404  ORF Transcript_29069/g.61404 Transcript_29069/m.61404 type:complete len:82 (+) Transcript_29069:440-685(+)
MASSMTPLAIECSLPNGSRNTRRVSIPYHCHKKPATCPLFHNYATAEVESQFNLCQLGNEVDIVHTCYPITLHLLFIEEHE